MLKIIPEYENFNEGTFENYFNDKRLSEITDQGLVKAGVKISWRYK